MKLLFLGVLIVSMQAAEIPVRELTTQAAPFPRSKISVYRHGYLITFPPRNQSGAPAWLSEYGFSAWAPDGSLAYQTSIEVPDGSHPVAYDLDFNAEGEAVVAASALSDQSKLLAGLLFLDRTGRQTGFTSTFPYFPGHLAIAPDGSIWTLGWQNNHEDYRMVRHFSAGGAQLGAFLPRSAFPAGIEPGGPGAGPQISATSDRIDVLGESGKQGPSMEWVELDWNGNVLDRLRMEDQVADVVAFAVTDDHRVFLSGLNNEVYELDRAAQVWKLIRKSGPTRLLGADGKDLVFEKQGSVPIALQWFHAP